MGDIDASFDELKQAAKSMSDGIQALENAVTAISEAVIIEDEEKLSSALNSAYDALGDIVGAMTEMSSVFGEITDTFALVMAWSEDLTTSIDAIADAMTKMSGALVNIQSGVDSLRKNISFDLDGIKNEGYKVTTPMVICNTDDYASVDAVAQGEIKKGEKILEIK